MEHTIEHTIQNIYPQEEDAQEKKRLDSTQSFSAAAKKWNDRIEKNIKDIGDNCITHKLMYIEMSLRSKSKYNILMYLAIVLGPACGIFSIMYKSYNFEFLQIIAVLFGLSVGILNSIIKFGKFNAKGIMYKSASNDYSYLGNNIRQQLNLNRVDRDKVGPFYQWVVKSYDELSRSAPSVPYDVYMRYIKEIEIAIDKKDDEQEPKKSQKKRKIKKSDSYPTLNRFTDEKMRYEMTRFSGDE